MDNRDHRTLLTQFYVSKMLKKDPVQAVVFIRKNRSYFQNISDDVISAIIKEHNISQEKLDSIVVPTIDPLDKEKQEYVDEVKKSKIERDKIMLEKMLRKMSQ